MLGISISLTFLQNARSKDFIKLSKLGVNKAGRGHFSPVRAIKSLSSGAPGKLFSSSISSSRLSE